MIIRVCLLIILILINGILSLCELSFLSIKKIDLKKDIDNGNKKAKEVSNILLDMSGFLSTIQVGITLAGFLASAFAADYFADYFMEYIKVTVINRSVFRGILLVIITLILSYVTLVFGELIPKKMAISNPKKYAYKYVGIIKNINIIFKPIVTLLTKSTEVICKLLNIKDKEDRMSEEDIRNMILLGKEEGALEENETNYLMNVFKFNDILVKDIMTPKEDVITLSLDNDLKENIKIIKDEKYSRYPVLKEGKIIGIINVKDIVLSYSETDKVILEKLVKNTSKYMSNELIDDVFHQMRDRCESVGLVYENNEFVGIVSVEDLMEEIVGNIYDEYDEKVN